MLGDNPRHVPARLDRSFSGVQSVSANWTESKSLTADYLCVKPFNRSVFRESDVDAGAEELGRALHRELQGPNARDLVVGERQYEIALSDHGLNARRRGVDVVGEQHYIRASAERIAALTDQAGGDGNFAITDIGAEGTGEPVEVRHVDAIVVD